MNRTTPGDVLNEFSETYCNPRNKDFVQNCSTFIVGYVLLYIHCRVCSQLETPLLHREDKEDWGPIQYNGGKYVVATTGMK